MAERDAWEQPLYRFAAVLLRDAGLARKVTIDTLEATIRKPPFNADDERLAMLLFQGVRRRALAATSDSATRKTATTSPRGDLPVDAAAVVAPASPERIEVALHALPEPGRSALALLLLDAMEADYIAKILGLAEAEFAQALHGARLALHAALTTVQADTSTNAP